jgi:putative holliday junction resolvase
MRYLGIDYGSANIGLAMADSDSKMAMPFDTIRENEMKKVIAIIEQIIIDEDIDHIVVGYPLTLEGSESAQSAETISFITELSGTLSIPVDKEDERLTSKFAQTLIREAEGSGGHDDHALAASSILQTFIDRK